MSDRVTLVEVGPRDGLQNEKTIIPAGIKIELIKRLANCGLPVVEASSFVSPKWIPQLADAAEVMAGLDLNSSTRYPVLVPNLQGLERAILSGAREVAVFAAASESFSQKNINCSIAESLQRLRPIIAQARSQDITVRGYISCVLGCPYEGAVAIKAVQQLAEDLLAAGCFEISLGDTIGVGTANQARAMIRDLTTTIPVEKLAVHFHDTYGQALANILACMDLGIRIVDASVAGLGGCPYARGATGNVATEDVTYMLAGMGMETGVDLAALVATGQWISNTLGRGNSSRAGRTLAKH
ncbi:MAG: hydroxymethylglutaryl-CoA lyase [Xanthomonadales bacterium]|nr:hydroxymethylglutaryl-CoA lyase [Xanthomonadales bacterium]